jgi:hypothetical protein
MAAKVYNYQQPADYLRCTNTTATMQRDDRRQGFPPGEAYPWFNQPTYSLSHDNLSVSYSDPSNLSGTHGANYNHETHGYSTGYSHDLSAAVEGSPANTTWEVSLDPHAIYHVNTLSFFIFCAIYLCRFVVRCHTTLRVGRAPRTRSRHTSVIAWCYARHGSRGFATSGLEETESTRYRRTHNTTGLYPNFGPGSTPRDT